MNTFPGFEAHDFEGIAGTHWRRDIKADLIEIIGAEFKAWPVYKWQMVFIGPGKYNQPDVDVAKLYVATDDDNGGGVDYGLYHRIGCQRTIRFVPTLAKLPRRLDRRQ